jgi:hypothetical protein
MGVSSMNMLTTTRRWRLEACVFVTALLAFSNFAPAATARLPAIFAVHEEYILKHTSLTELTKTVQSTHAEGAFRPGTHGQVYLASCKSIIAIPQIVVFDDKTILAFAKKILPANNPTIGWIEKTIQSKSKDPDSQPWRILSSDVVTLRVVKAWALTEAGLAPPGGPTLALSQAEIPAVFILLPIDGMYMSSQKQSSIFSIPGNINSSVNAWTRTERGLNPNYIVLGKGSLKALPGEPWSRFKTTLSHELGHYLSLPHTYISDETVVDYSAKAAAVANEIKDSGDCGKSTQFDGSAIKDVDYLEWNAKIGDTVPVWIGRKDVSDICLDEYDEQLKQDGWVKPLENLMHSGGRRESLLSKEQAMRVVERVNALLAQPAPQNLCR